ncbi:MAG: BACON domain-containing protein, partial [Acidobacteriota bacterium]
MVFFWPAVAGGRPMLRQGGAAAGATQLPGGLSLADWVQIRDEYERHRHGMFPDGAGGFRARSHSQGLLARFDGRGVAVQPDGGAWSWGLELESWGRAGQEERAGGGARVVREGNRLEYQREGIREWFVNGAEGLEHGFTVMQRPAGAGGPLRMRLRQRGELGAGEAPGEEGIVDRTAAGAGALRYRKLMVKDARGRRLGARMAAAGKMVEIVVEDGVAAYPITVDPLVQHAFLKASNTGAGDHFGSAVALAGDTLVVSADQEASGATGVNGDQSNNSAPNAGAVYVFVRSGGSWSQQAYLKASNTGGGDRFGTSVAISGDTVVVGASGEDSDAVGVNAPAGTGGCAEGDAGCQPGTQSSNASSWAGAAYVYVRTGSTWSQQAYLKASNPGASDQFGATVGLSGDTVVVGAPIEASTATGVDGYQDNECAPGSGAAYVFVRSGSMWSQQAYLKASNTGGGDLFGYALAIAGDTIVVGAYAESSSATGVNGNESDDSRSAAGAAYVFVRSGGTWLQQAYLKASNTEAGDVFGNWVAIFGDTVVVGAPWEDSNATGVNGTQGDNSATDAGAAYVFVRSGGSWSQQAYLKASNTGAGDNFGYSVAIDGDTVAVPARYERSDATGVNATLGTGGCAEGDAGCQAGTQSNNALWRAGAFYGFVRSAGSGAPQVYGKASNTGMGDRVRVVAISGGTLVAGAWGEDSDATGANAPLGTGGCALSDATCQPGTQSNDGVVDSGAVYGFRWEAASLAPATNLPPGPGATGQVVLVNAEPWIAWTAVSNAGWLTITSGASGVGPGSVTYDCAPLASVAGRTGTLTIGGKTHTVTQSGLTGSVTLSAASDAVGAAGRVGGTVGVASNATDFGWTAVSDAAWLTVTAGAAGTGNGTVTYSVAANGTAVASRTGRLTIGGQTFTVTQGGVTGSVTLSLASDAVGVAGRVGGTVGVASNATDFGWTAVSDAAWLT